MIGSHAVKAKPNSMVGRLFLNSWDSIKPYVVLNKAKTMIKMGPSQEEANKLQIFLNGIYGAKKNKNYNTISDKLEKAVSAFIEELVQDVKIVEDDGSGQGKITTSKKQKTHSYRIKFDTINRTLNELQMAINQGSLQKLNEIYGSGNLEDLAIQIQDAIQEIKDDPVLKSIFITNAGFDKGFLRTGVDPIQQIPNIVANIDEINRVLSLANMNLGAIYGEGFERSLDALSQILNDQTHKKTDEILEEVFSKGYRTAGSSQANRGSLREGYDLSYQLVQGQRDYIWRKAQYETAQQALKSGNMVQITAFDETKGKMDVNFILPDENGGINFRVSAKSWSTMNDFGDTTLFNAMVRTVGINDTLSWGLVQGYYGPKGKIYPEIEAYKYAKVCLLVDTVMGYSQKNNYVDTIIIQDRTDITNPIKVFSMKTILEKIENQIDLIPISEFDDVLTKINLTTKSSKWWLSTLQSQMHSKRIAIGAGLLKLVNENFTI